jgi:large subunit ribosomal protein L25
MNETLTLSVVSLPQGVTLLDDPEETVIATITPPTQEPVEEEIETETELVGEDGEPIEAAVEGEEAEVQAEGATGDEAASASDDES